MLRRQLGRTGLAVSEVGLGTWGLSGDAYGSVVEAEVDRVLDRALDAGITIFDTADVYGRGAMERRLGHALKGTEAKEDAAADAEADAPPGSVRTATYVVTKIGTDVEAGRKRFDPAYLRVAFERSRERLQRDVVDVVLMHNPTVAGVERSDGPAFLEELRSARQIRGWGVSAGSAEVARAAIAHGAGVIELVYNAFAASDLHGLAADVAEHDVAVLARSVLAHGLLAGQWSAAREFFPGDHRLDRWTPGDLARRVSQLGALRPLVADGIATVRAVALRFVLANQIVSSAIVGPRSVAQLDQMVREVADASPYLSGEQLADLADRLRAAGVST